MSNPKKKRRIRPLALCVFRRRDMIFVSQGYDSRNEQTFYRPIGGKIEFGERGADAVAREAQEEIGAEIVGLKYLGALENIFTYEDAPYHEIVLIYDGRFVDTAMNVDDVQVQGLDDGEILYEAAWKRLDFFRGPGAPPLYPAGLLELLDSTMPN